MIARYRLAKPLFPRGRASFQKSRTQSGSDSSMRESWFRFDVLDLIIVTHRVGIAVPLQGT